MVCGETGGEAGPVDRGVAARMPCFLCRGCAMGAAEEGLLADGEAGGGF